MFVKTIEKIILIIPFYPLHLYWFPVTDFIIFNCPGMFDQFMFLTLLTHLFLVNLVRTVPSDKTSYFLRFLDYGY